MVVGTLSLVQKGQTSGHSGIVVTVCSGMQWNSGIWWWGQCLWCKKVKPVDAVHSGHTTIYHYSTASTVSTAYCIHWFDLFAPKTMSPSPYTIIPLHPLCKYCVHCLLHLLCTASTAFTGLTFLHQRQCPHHHIPLFHCVHCILHPLHPLA